MRTRICAALVMMMGVATAGAQQMKSAHASSAPTTKAATAPKLESTPVNQPTSSKAPSMVPAMQPTGKVVARVNGAELTDRDLLREMMALFPYAAQHNGFPKELEPEIRRGALQMIIFDELVYQQAKSRNLSVAPDKLTLAEKQFRNQFPSQKAYQQFVQTEAKGSESVMREKIRRAMLIDLLLNKEVNTPARISVTEAKAAYEKNIADYKHPEILHIQSISIIPPNQTKSVSDEARRRAEDAAKQAKAAKNYREFGMLAEQMSDDDFHVNMGDHKPQPAIALPPPIVQAASKMKPGDVSELIKLGNNYTIFRLESRTPAGITPFNEVQAKLQAEMQKEKAEQLRSALAQKLGQNAKIEKL